MTEPKKQAVPKNKSGNNSMGNKGNPKKPFNFYWIYVAIGIILIGIHLFQYNSTERKTTWDKFVNTMLKTDEVQRIVVVTTGNESRVEIFIKPEALQQDKYKAI